MIETAGPDPIRQFSILRGRYGLKWMEKKKPQRGASTKLGGQLFAAKSWKIPVESLEGGRSAHVSASSGSGW